MSADGAGIDYRYILVKVLILCIDALKRILSFAARGMSRRVGGNSWGRRVRASDVIGCQRLFFTSRILPHSNTPVSSDYTWKAGQHP